MLTEKAVSTAAAKPCSLLMQRSFASFAYTGFASKIIAALLAADIRKPTSQHAIGSMSTTVIIAAPRLSIAVDSVLRSCAKYRISSINPALRIDIPKPATAI